MTLSILEVVWYSIFIVVVMGYVVLDGFDLGVGMLHLATKGDNNRRIFLNAIGPVWDGNEVWLVVVFGSLLAGFPYVYATVLSAFYIPVMGLIAGLIFRAVSIEFRGKREGRRWRSFWDFCFCAGSWVIAAGLGLVLGNLVQGLPLDQYHEYAGSFATFFRPYPLLVMVTTLGMLMMHGAIFLVMKTEGALHDQLRRWAIRLFGLFLALYIVTTVATLLFMPHMTLRLREHPWIFSVAVVNLLCILNVARCLRRGWDGWAFMSSCANICALVALYAIGMFPNLVLASNNPEYSLTVSNSYASLKTLQVLLVIVIIGIPLALAYIISVYYLFRGKVRLDSHSY
jgi:cytochrome bd ubiquinol oxidase subunit II